MTWVYTRAGMPVEITAELDNWRRIRDWEGAEGWVYHSLLSGRRTGGGDAQGQERTRAAVSTSGDSKAAWSRRLQPGVLAAIKRCTGSWCRIAGPGFDGWIVQERLWGVYPNEKVRLVDELQIRGVKRVARRNRKRSSAQRALRRSRTTTSMRATS